MSKSIFFYYSPDFQDLSDLLTVYRDYVNGKWVSKLSGTPYKSIFDLKCECGCNASMISVDIRYKPLECPRCGSDNSVYLDKKYSNKMFNLKFKLDERDGRNFYLSSERCKVLFKKDGSTVIKSLGYDKFEFIDGKVSVNDFKGNRVDTGVYYGKINPFERWRIKRGLNISDIIKVISKDEEELRYLLFLYNNLLERSRNYYDRSRSIVYALEYNYKNSFIEKMYKSNLNEKMVVYAIDNVDTFDIGAKKLHQIFKVPKSGMRIVNHMKSMYFSDIRSINNFLTTLDGTRLNVMMNIVEEETLVSNLRIIDFIDYIIKLHEVCGYNNIEALTSYLCRRTKLEQGLDNPVESARLLYDYINIMKNELNFEYERYPKSLKKVHDLAVMNYNVLKKKLEESKFLEAVEKEDYKSLEFEGEFLSVVSPKKVDDVVLEGQTLSHCVASYVKDIANNLCKILFVRQTKYKNDSYMTVEVRNNEIKQFKGSSNRKASEFDLEFIKKWAEEKNLNLREINQL